MRRTGKLLYGTAGFGAVVLATLLVVRGFLITQGEAPPEDRVHHHRLLLDITGDGFDLGGTNPNLGTRWTKPHSANAWLIVDADALRLLGFAMAIRSESGSGPRSAASGFVPLQNDARVVRPDGTAVVVSDCWEMLDLFDANRDGAVDQRDPVWSHLRLFFDEDGDGHMDFAELREPGKVGLAAIGPSTRAETQDALGNVLVLGWIRRASDGVGRAADVSLAEVAFPLMPR